MKSLRLGAVSGATAGLLVAFASASAAGKCAISMQQLFERRYVSTADLSLDPSIERYERLQELACTSEDRAARLLVAGKRVHLLSYHLDEGSGDWIRSPTSSAASVYGSFHPSR